MFAGETQPTIERVFCKNPADERQITRIEYCYESMLLEAIADIHGDEVRLPLVAQHSRSSARGSIVLATVRGIEQSVVEAFVASLNEKANGLGRFMATARGQTIIYTRRKKRRRWAQLTRHRD